MTDKSCLNKTGQLFRVGCCQEKQKDVEKQLLSFSWWKTEVKQVSKAGKLEAILVVG